MKLFPAKCHKRATLRKLWHQTARKQFTVSWEILTAIARDQSEQLKVAWCCCRNLSAFFQNLLLFCFAIIITNHLMTSPFGNSEFCFPQISRFLSTSSREASRFWETKFTVPLGTSHQVFIITKQSLEEKQGECFVLWPSP